MKTTVIAWTKKAIEKEKGIYENKQITHILLRVAIVFQPYLATLLKSAPFSGFYLYSVDAHWALLIIMVFMNYF